VKGAKFAKRFARLKTAASEASAWTAKVQGWMSATPDLEMIDKNRSDGLFEATHRGNVMRNLDISHQLDTAYQ
jgi:hypothetical protein